MRNISIKVNKKYVLYIVISLIVLIGISIPICKYIRYSKERNSSTTIYRTADGLYNFIMEIDKNTEVSGDFQKEYNEIMNIPKYLIDVELEKYNIHETEKIYQPDYKYLIRYSKDYRENAELYINTGENKYKEELENIKTMVEKIKNHYEGCYERQGIFSKKERVEPLYTEYSDD